MLTVNRLVADNAGMPAPGKTRVQTAFDAWLDTCRSPNTRAAYKFDVEHFMAWCRTVPVDPLAPRSRDLDRYRAACEAAGAGRSTMARRLSAIASFSAFVAPGGLHPDIARPAQPPRSNAGLLSDRDAAALLAAADRLHLRAAVLVRLLMLDGLKVGEAVNADAADVSGRPPRVSLTLHGRTTRTILLHPETARALHGYLARRRSGPLLLSERRDRTDRPDRLTRFGIDYVVKQIALEAGVQAAVSGNMLRRRYVTAAHAAGASIDDIRRHAGHVDERTTRRYLPDG